jgi:hypothetical protein
MQLPKFIRIQGREKSYITQKPVGIFTLCYRRVRDDVFNETEKTIFQEVDKWFNEHLPHPPFYGESNDNPNANTKKAVTYFKTNNCEIMLKQLVPLFDLCDKYNIPFDIIYTNYPGNIIYEDEFQIGVVDDI